MQDIILKEEPSEKEVLTEFNYRFEILKKEFKRYEEVLNFLNRANNIDFNYKDDEIKVIKRGKEDFLNGK